MHVLLIGTGFIFIAKSILIALIAANQARSVTGIEKAQGCVEPMNVNYLAPAIRLTDIAGSTISLADHKGAVIFLNT